MSTTTLLLIPVSHIILSPLLFGAFVTLTMAFSDKGFGGQKITTKDRVGLLLGTIAFCAPHILLQQTLWKELHVGPYRIQK